MKAYRRLNAGSAAGLTTVPVPRPGPGEVLLRVGAAGVCGTDLELLRATAPFTRAVTLGHENAGWVDAAGPGVDDLETGQAVLVSCVRFCGDCAFCRTGAENHCASFGARGITEDGGFAEYMIADRRQLVTLKTLSPTEAAPLADAGLSAYHAVTSAIRHAHGAETMVIVGVGGLGGFAVQYAKAVSGVRVVAIDRNSQRLRTALELGAAQALHGDEDWPDAIDGADAVVDFVGTDATLAAAVNVVRPGGAIVVAGRGGGILPFGRELVPPGVALLSSRGGTMRDLEDVVRLAESGVCRASVEEFALEDIATALHRLAEGTLGARAVITFPTPAKPLPWAVRDQAPR